MIEYSSVARTLMDSLHLRVAPLAVCLTDKAPEGVPNSTPLPPSTVLFFANSRQSLAITEAVQQVEPGIPPALGRPACAVIAQAVNTGKPAMSLGCCGARAYLNVLTDDFALWALPGARIAEYAERIRVLA